MCVSRIFIRRFLCFSETAFSGLLENGVLKICSKFTGGNDDDHHGDDDYEELFCVMVDRRKAFSLVRDLHHRESLTHCEQDLNLCRT